MSSRAFRSLGALLAAAAIFAGSAVARASSSPARGSLAPVRYDLDLRVDFGNERISGSARITLVNAGTSPEREASFLLYRLMRVAAVRDARGAPAPFRQSVVAFEDWPQKQTNHVIVALKPPLPPGRTTVLTIEYGGYLAGYVETGSLYIQDRVDEAFTIIREDADAYPTVRVPSSAKNRAAGLPDFDYTARITVPESHVVANGGVLVERTVRGGLATYVYRNARPAWRMDFAIARYETIEGPGLRVFFLPGDGEGARRVLEAARASMALYRDWFGPLHDAPAFTVIEIPDGWGSQADVTSILQAAAAFRDPAKLHELYHETSHLWNVRALDRPSCRWEEGLATFLERLLEVRFAGGPPLADRALEVARSLRDSAAKEPRLKTVPMIDYGKEEMTGYAYRTGMLMFNALYNTVGPERFNAIVGGYYQKYQATGATTAQFVALAQTAAARDLRPLFDEWLYTTRWYEALPSDVSPPGSEAARARVREGLVGRAAAP